MHPEQRSHLETTLVRVAVVGSVIILLISICLTIIFASDFPAWTGFGPPAISATGQSLPGAKTLWDWLDLLLVPLVIAVGGYFLSRSESRYALSLQQRREEEGRAREEQRAQEAALEAYIEHMAQLIKDGLITSIPSAEVRSIARAHTLAVLRRLNGERKGNVLFFLADTNLISTQTVQLYRADISKAYLTRGQLKNADLRDSNLADAQLNLADLSNAFMSGSILDRAELCRSDLNKAILQSASLQRANLQYANLCGVDFSLANLKDADLSNATYDSKTVWPTEFDPMAVGAILSQG